MGRFEDQLWAELAQAHGDELAATQRLPVHRGRARPIALTASAFGVVGAVTAATLALTATTGTPAYAVTQNPDGTVVVTIHDLIGVTGANAELAKLGVPIRAVTIGSDCHDTFHPDPNHPRLYGTALVRSAEPDEVTVRPAALPVGDTLLLAAHQSGSRVAVSVSIVRGPAPSCLARIHHVYVPGESANPSTRPSR